MSAEISADLKRIQDEDVLRKMWADTEDFGKKKEIRSHMYKLREARLKDFYTTTSDNVNNTEIHHQSSTTTSKSNMGTTHADSLTDQSYVKLKSKEVRDSESPTRDHFSNNHNINNNNNTSISAMHQDQGWKIDSSHEKSIDGKLHKSSHTATTSGTQDIDNGKLNYAAKIEEKSSVFQDDNVKQVGTSSSSFVHQEASGSDKNSNFKSSINKTSSSSRYVSESGTQINDNQAIDSINHQKTFTNSNNIPSDLKNNPNYIEGKTKVTQETKTLADGTVVTTTKYETKDGNSTQSASHTKYSNVNNNKASSSSSQFYSSSGKTTSGKNVEYVIEPESHIEIVDHISNKTAKNEQYTNTSKKTSDRENYSSETRRNQINNGKEEVLQYVEIPVEEFVKTTKNTTHDQKKSSTVENKKFTINDEFIVKESQDQSQRIKETNRDYVPIEKRPLIKPDKAELDEKLTSNTEGQYSTTYRSEFTNKNKVSVDVSASHDAFARSLRSITPERIGKYSPKSSSTYSINPEKKYPCRNSPDRQSRSRSPKKSSDKFSSNETITYSSRKSSHDIEDISSVKRSDNYYNSTRKSKLNEADFKKKSKSPSPIRNYDNNKETIITDLDDDVEIIRTSTRPSTLELSTKKSEKRITESCSSPIKPTKKDKSPEKEFQKPQFVRTNTYEEHVKGILGLKNKTTSEERRRSSLEKSSMRRDSLKETVQTTTTTRNEADLTKRTTQKSNRSPERLLDYPVSNNRKLSPEKEFPGTKNKSPLKAAPLISEFPSQLRKSPERKPSLEPYPEKKSPTKSVPSGISEFPSQIRKSPEKELREPSYPEKKSPTKNAPGISEFPSQIRKSPEREPLEPYPEKKSPTKNAPGISEFPSQIRKSPEKELLEPYPEKKSPRKTAPGISEFPSQIRKSPEIKPLEPYPGKKSPTKTAPTVSEFPSQVKKSPEKEPLEPYPEKQKQPAKAAPGISEFPSQTKKLPDKTATKAPLKPVKKDTFGKDHGIIRARADSVTSTSSEDDFEKIEEKIQITTVESSKKPVVEAVVEKKIFQQLCKADEELIISKKKATEKLIESEIMDAKKTRNNLTTRIIRKPTEIPKSGSSNTVKTDTVRKCINSVPKKPLAKTPSKKIIEISIETKPCKISTNNNIAKKSSPQNIYRTEKSKFIGTTEYQSQFNKTTPQKEPFSTRKPIKTEKKITLQNMDNSEQKLKSDKNTNLRTTCSNALIKKKVTKTIHMNGESPKPKPKTIPNNKSQISPGKIPTSVNNKITKKTCHSSANKISSTNNTKKHVVTATINVCPRKHPMKIQKPCCSSSCSEDESECESTASSFVDLTENKRNQFTRTSSDKTFNSQTKTPIRGFSKPDLYITPQETTKSAKIITTKTVLINNDDDDKTASDKEIVVKLQRSHSSREPTPDRICARPLTSDEEDEVNSPIRYPDQISEPDDGTFRRNKPKKLTDIPIFESEDGDHHQPSITDITEALSKISPVDKVDECDESLLTIDKKIDKFLNTAEKLTKAPIIKSKPSRTTKFDEITIEISEDLKGDECLLSVSDKVNKFVNTADKLNTSIIEKPKGQPAKEIGINIQGKLKDYKTSIAEDATKTLRTSTTTNKNVLLDELNSNVVVEDESLKSDDCLLSVSDKVNKFVSTAEKLKSVDLTKIATEDAPIKEKSIRFIDNERIHEEITRKSPEKSRSPSPVKSPVRKSSTESSKNMKKTKALFENKETTKMTDECGSSSASTIRKSFSSQDERSGRRSKSPEKLSSKEEPMQLTRFRASSPEKIPEIKILPETEDINAKIIRSREPTPERDLPHYMKPLDRNNFRASSPEKIPENQILSETDDEVDKINGKIRSRESSPENDLPHYMKPLDRSLRPSSHKENNVKSSAATDVDGKPTKFGVTLRRTDSLGKTVKTNENNYLITDEKVVSSEYRITDEEVEEIFSLEILEKLLEETVGYEIRRKIRTQIRLVKKLISENTLNEYICKRTNKKLNIRGSSPAKSVEINISSKIVNEGKSSIIEQSRKSPQRKLDSKTNENSYGTLKKVTPAPTLNKTEDSQPEWVRQRNLKNSKERITSSTSLKTTKKTTTSRLSPAKEIKGTDVITSSYGVGPTDENGTPLFGLRALRAQNKNETTKVQGTIIQSEYYSESNKEPVGQVSVTKYSTDPRDLNEDGLKSVDGKMTSVTTTQKFGYKDTPSLKSLTDNKKKICDTTETTTTNKSSTKINRRGSVKEISKKFIDNAVETLKNEQRQTTYPKAGLILRSSSFKNTNNGEKSSRESSPEEISIRTMRKSSASASSSEKTFLSNKTKITGVQDVLSRMKNEEEYVEGENEEDIAARGLLNKFLGSQVILSGMEVAAKSSSASSSATRRTTKITTTTTESSGEIKTQTRVFQRPVSVKDLQTVWDEETLKLLLEQSTEIEERRLIRARLREIMAELEACTALVDDAIKSADSQSISSPITTPSTPAVGQLEGESQLLPLLQGLLNAPENNDVTPDSGTESGEDHQRSNLIAEVQTALDKLSSSLLSADQTDITAERRSSLLQLVNKLQAGLSGSSNNNNNNNSVVERRSSAVVGSSSTNIGRFQKKKNKQNRHTVGVSKEELADARRLIEQISFNNELSSSARVSASNNNIKLSKQNSESSVPSSSSAHSSYKNLHQNKVKNSTAKPYSSSNSTSSSTQTPTEHLLEAFDFNNDEKENNVKPSSLVDLNSKSTSVIKEIAANEIVAEESASEEDEDETGTIKGNSDIEINAPLKSNPIYSKPNKLLDSHHLEEKISRFDTQKKLKMKRANTIDIPKPLIFYEDDDDSELEQDWNRKGISSQLRGPLNVGNPNTKKIVPLFEPKTDSDKKFVAFINRHNEQNANNKGSIWTNNSSVWGNRFGNIKSSFEHHQNKPANNNSQDAKSFWKSADDNIKKSTVNQFGPKISKQSARNLQQMFEEKQKENLQQKVNNNNNNNKYSNYHQSEIVTGSLKVKTQPEKNYRVIPQPLPVNQFSHAPQSAFKPIVSHNNNNHRASLVFSPPSSLEGQEILKKEIKENGHSSFLYSPKPLSSSVESSTVTSPVSSKPWAVATNQGNSRVLSLAASKFEPPLIKNKEHSKIRKSSKDSTTGENIVRKLSGQYEFHQDHKPAQTYQIKTSVVESQFVKPAPSSLSAAAFAAAATPQNYRIIYGQPRNPQPPPQNYSIRYDQPNKIIPPQNYSIRYDQVPQIPPAVSYSIKYDEPRNPHAIYQQQYKSAGKEQKRRPETDQFTSTCEFQRSSSTKVAPVQAVIEPLPQQTLKPQRQISKDDHVLEHNAVSSKVMTGPVSQQAVTVRQKSPMNRDQHDLEAAFNLRNSLQKVNNGGNGNNNIKSPSRSPSNSFSYKSSARELTKIAPQSLTQSFKYTKRTNPDIDTYEPIKYKPSDCPKPTVAPSSFKFKSTFEDTTTTTHRENKNCGVVKPIQQQQQQQQQQQKPKIHVQKDATRNLSIITGQFSIPVINVKSPESPRVPHHQQILSKSDSWHEICMAHKNSTNENVTPKLSAGPVKSKSSNTLALPKLYEAGMSKEEMLNKRRTMEAFLVGKPANNSDNNKAIKRSINRVKTSQKVSTQNNRSSGAVVGLVRSRTLPDIICPNLLDESNIDKAFNDLFESS